LISTLIPDFCYNLGTIYAIIVPKRIIFFKWRFIMIKRKFLITAITSLVFIACIFPAMGETVDEWIDRGCKLCIEEDYEEGIECYDKAIEEAPGYFYTWIYKGYALELSENPLEAGNCFNKAFSINPVEAYLWYCKLGDMYKKGKELSGLGKHKEAGDFFDSIFLMNPFEAYSTYRKVDDLYKQALGLFNTGKYEESIECLDKAIQMEPTNSILQELRDRCCDMLEN